MRQQTSDSKMRFQFSFRFLTFLFLVCSLQSVVCGLATAEQAVVLRVIDGDTVVLEDGTRVRLIGINAPEIENRDYGHRGEPYGEDAKKILKQMVEGKKVDLKEGAEKEDRYGRRLAYLYLPQHFFVNRKLVEMGAAEAYRKFLHEFLADFMKLESQARQKKLGMWAIEKHEPTWWERLFGVKP